MRYAKRFPSCWLLAVWTLTIGSGWLWGASVDLAWDPNAEPNVVGYNVYRSLTSGAGFVRLNGSLVSVAYFSDAGVDEGRRYYYVVTAVASNGLESSFSNQVSVLIEIEPEPEPNQPPVAVADTFAVAEDSFARLDVLANDTDADGDALSVGEVGQGRNGTVSLESGQVFYRPYADFNGSDSFTYTVSDGKGGNNAGEVQVSVTPVNDPPLAGGDSAETDEDSSVTIPVLNNDLDVDGDKLTIIAVTTPGHGTASVRNSRNLRYSPNPDFFGADSFSYIIEDTGGLRGEASVRVLVRPVNDAPRVDAGDDRTVFPGQQVILEGVVVDPDDQQLRYRWTQLKGPQVSLQNADTLQAGFRLSESHKSTRMTFELTADDGQETGSDRVVVIVKASSLLLFPANVPLSDDGSGDSIVGVAVVNSLDQEEELHIMGVDAQGNPLPEDRRSNLGPGGQSAFVTRDVAELSQATLLVADNGGGALQGFFMMGDAREVLDGVGGELDEAEQLFIPVARSDERSDTVVYLLNPHPEEPAEAVLRLFDADGAALADASLSLAGLGSVRGTLAEIFGELGSVDGFVRVDADRPLRGFQLNRGEGNLASLPALSPKAVDRFLIPHFFLDDQGGDTEIRLINPGDRQATVDLRAYDDSRKLLGERREVIRPGGLLSMSAASVIVEAGASAQVRRNTSSLQAQGFVEIDVKEDDTALVATVAYFANNGRITASIPMVHNPRREHLFLHVAQSEKDRLFTGVAVLNPNDQAAEIKLEAFDADGNRTAEAHIVLPARSRFVDLLNGEKIFGSGFSQTSGHWRLSSDLPVAGSALFGDHQGRYLAAIEPQPAGQRFE